MRRLQISKQVIGGCIACCAAAILMIGLAGLGHTVAGGLPQATRASSAPHNPLQARAALAARVPSPGSVRVSEHYKQFPLAFEPNREQTNNLNVKFLARGEGYIVFLTGKEAVFSMGKDPHAASVLRMSLVGANAQPGFSGVDELPGKSNYFIGNQPEKWRTNIPNYRKVAERNVYPGIDLVYYGTQRQLEYDFVITPGASPNNIQIAFSGANNLRADANGDLLLSVAGSDDVRLHKPVAYQQSGAEKQLVAANYILKGNGVVEFGVGSYDPSRPLIVDPILAYSTYLGGSNIDSANSIAVAPDNTAFIAGGTFSADFPTIHALQPNAGGVSDFPQDAFVSKISADGSTLLYSTYLGGESRDVANGIAVDTFGNAYVVGTTISPHFPVTTGAFDTICGADGKCGVTWNSLDLPVTNAFVSKLNAAGSGLIYSTYYGYFENVAGQSIAVDANENAYITGYTTVNFTPDVPIIFPKLPPPPFPISANAFQSAYGGGSTNAFIAKLDATGAASLYSSYLGGNIQDVGYGITVDGNANAFVTGLTYSTTFPTTAGAIQAAFGGAGDAFIAKINTSPSGGALLYSTYLGGAGLDQGSGIALDGFGNAYVTGLTNSSSFGFTPVGTFQTTNHGEGDAFVAKLTGAGALSYFTYLGGTKADAGTGIAVDSTGNAYVTGSTVSTDFPTAGAVFQPAYGGGNADSFVAKLDPVGATLLYSSFLGGTNTELATGIAVDADGNAYVTGQTCSEDFPLANPLQDVPGGNCDAYVAKVSILAGFALNPAGLVFSAQSLNTTSAPQTVTITNGDSPQTISSIAITGANAADFSESTNCPINSTFAVGATCTITVTFDPSAQGIRKATVAITDTVLGSPQKLALTGNTSTVSLSTASLSFGFQQVDTSSAQQPVTVTNSGTTPLAFSSITASGDFSETDNCTKAPLQPNTTCVIQVVFTPSAAAGSIGAITLTDNGSGSPQVILATGTGTLGPQVTLSTNTVTFASQTLGTSSPAQAVTLTNTGSSTLVVSGVTSTGDFSQINTCPANLAAGKSCTINITFTPTASGNRLGSVTITDNAANSPQSIALSGSTNPTPVPSFSPTSLPFGTQVVGTPTAPQIVTLANSGNATLAIASIAATGDFTQSNNCGTSLAAGASCSISVIFTPSAGDARTGSLTVTDNAAIPSQSVLLSGTGAFFQVTSSTPTPAVPAGKSATFALTVSSIGGFAQPVSLSCTAPATLTCAVSPSTVTPTAGNSQPATLMVTTALRTFAPPSPGIKIDPLATIRGFRGTWLLWLSIVMMVMTIAFLRRRPMTAAFGFAAVLLLALVACSGSGTPGVPAGTPAGTYQVTVIASSGSATSPTTLTLQVK